MAVAEVKPLPPRSSAAEQPPTGKIAVKGESVFRFAFRDQKFLYGTEGEGDNAILLNPDPVLEEEGGDLGLGIYDEDCDGDPHLSGLYETRAQTVIGLGWEIQAAAEGLQYEAEAEFIRRLFWAIPRFEEARRQMLVGELKKGYSFTEILWGGVDGFTMILALLDHDPRSFVFDAAWRPRIVTNPADLAGSKPVDSRKYVVLRHRAKAWNPYGVGIGQTLHYVAQYKKHVLNFAAVYCEKLASPTVDATYEGSAARNEAQILEMAEKAMERSAVAHDKSVTLKPLILTGDFGAYTSLLGILNDEESVAVLGQVLSSTAKPTGLNSGVADEQGGVRQDYKDYDAQTMADGMNELVRMAIDANYGPRPANLYPKAVIPSKPRPDTAKVGETIQIAQDIGLEVGENYAREALGVPKPKPGEAILEKPQTMVSAFSSTTTGEDPLDTGRGGAGGNRGTNPASEGEAGAA